MSARAVVSLKLRNFMFKIIPSAGAPRILTREEQQKRNRTWIVTGISAAFLVELLLWGLNQFLSLRGVVNVLASRIILVCMMGPIGVLLATVIVWPIQTKRWMKTLAVGTSAILFCAALFALDAWT